MISLVLTMELVLTAMLHILVIVLLGFQEQTAVIISTIAPHRRAKMVATVSTVLTAFLAIAPSVLLILIVVLYFPVKVSVMQLRWFQPVPIMELANS